MRAKNSAEYPNRSLTPEHDARNAENHDTECEGPLNADISAAYQYVDSVLDTSDYVGTYAWHGWALREAFLAGISHAKKDQSGDPDPETEDKGTQ